MASVHVTHGQRLLRPLSCQMKLIQQGVGIVPTGVGADPDRKMLTFVYPLVYVPCQCSWKLDFVYSEA